MTKPALLGGPPAFDYPVPLARPARPPLEAVVARYEPSYESGMITNGRLVAELEGRVAERLGVAHVVAVSSCTSGLMLAAQALTAGSAPGSASGQGGRRAVLPSFTFAASAHAVAWAGLEPHFVECRPDTFAVDPEALPHALEGAALLVATHVFGAPCRPAEVLAPARAAGVPVLFDAAHALGATSGDRPVGGFGDAEVFSLTPTKIVVGGEGGLVATGDDELAAALRLGRDYANPGDYDSRFVGLNARLAEFNAALALCSLDELDDHLVRRRALAAEYRRGLAAVPGVACQLVDDADRSTFKDLTITVDAARFGTGRDEVVAALAAERVDTRRYFSPPVHRHLAYADLPARSLPVTDAVAGAVISLPIWRDLPVATVGRIVETIARIQAHADEIAARCPPPGREGS